MSDNSTEHIEEAEKKAPANDQTAFISNFVAKAKNTPKQFYKEAAESVNAETDSETTAEADEKSGGTQPPPEQSAPFSPIEDRTRMARSFIQVADMFAASKFAALAKTEEKSQFKASPDEITEMAEALAEGMPEMGLDFEMPWWAKLGIAGYMAYMPKYEMAKRMGEKPDDRSDEVQEHEQYRTIVVDREPDPPSSSEAPPFAVHFDNVKEANSEPAPQAEVVHEYWGEKGNPVSPEENENREKKGGKICQMCDENNAKPGKHTCSQSCAARRTTLLNKGIEPSRENWLKFQSSK